MSTTAMEDLLDGLRRIIHHWVNTSSPITADVSRGDDVIEVHSSHRFLKNDQVMIWKVDEGLYETGLVIDEIIDINISCKNT